MCFVVMHCVVPSVCMPRVCRHILVPAASDCCCGLVCAQGSALVVTTVCNKPTLSSMNIFLVWRIKHKYLMIYFSFLIAVNKKNCVFAFGWSHWAELTGNS